MNRVEHERRSVVSCLGGLVHEEGSMARESSNAKRLVKEDDAALPRILELARWPEREAEEEWNLEKWGQGSGQKESPRESARDELPSPYLHSVEPDQFADNPPDEIYSPENGDRLARGNYADWAELICGESLSHPAGIDKKARSGATRVMGGIAILLLLIGGGIYAYRNSPAFAPPPQQIAMPAPQAAPAKIASKPDAKPSPRSIPPAILSPSVPPPDIAVPALAPDEDSLPPRRSAQIPHRRVRRPVPDYELRDPLDAPMTLTPDTAPPPQQPAVPGLRYLPAWSHWGG
jgi:hypothetical protein